MEVFTMNKPSIKTLSRVFTDPKRAREILDMGRAELESLPAGFRRVSECYHSPKTYDIRMECLNEIEPRLYGLECFDTRKGPCFYLNAGDTYTPTLIYFQGRYSVTCWGDIAEKYA
jgi:hypothetical protein